MLVHLRCPDLDLAPRLRDAMLRDRARQFRDRLGWPVSVDPSGLERDAYDDAAASYLICLDARGRHRGSARLRPTLGPTMAEDHFLHLTGGRPIRDPRIWEVTRLCLAPGAGPEVAPLLLLGGAEVMRREGLTHLLGIFDAGMLRVYARIGSVPRVLGSEGGLSAGLWSEDAGARSRLTRRAGPEAREVEALVA